MLNIANNDGLIRTTWQPWWSMSHAYAKRGGLWWWWQPINRYDSNGRVINKCAFMYAVNHAGFQCRQREALNQNIISHVNTLNPTFWRTSIYHIIWWLLPSWWYSVWYMMVKFDVNIRRIGFSFPFLQFGCSQSTFVDNGVIYESSPSPSTARHRFTIHIALTL